MPSFQRSTAALTGFLLLIGSLTVGGPPASAEGTNPAPTAAPSETSVEVAEGPPADAESADVPVVKSVTAEATPAPADDHDSHSTTESEHAHEEVQPNTGPLPFAELPGVIPVSDHTFEGTVAPSGKQGGSSIQGGAMAPLGAGATLERRGNIDVKLVTVDLADSSATVPMTTVQSAMAHAGNYWKTMSNGRITMSVGSQVINHKSAARSTQSYSTIMNTVTAELKWSYSPYKALVVFIPSGLQGGILGYGWSSNGTSGRILMPQVSNFTRNVLTHEFGHVLGVMHADSLECQNGQSDTAVFGQGCSIHEYGDTSDLMGYARHFETPTISASFWDYGGFGRGDEIRNVGVASGRKTYTLSPWAGTAANRALKFTDPKSSETYYLELRTATGYDRNLALNGNRGVKITQSGGNTPASSIILMPSTFPRKLYDYATNTAWPAGSTFTTHAGTTVKINTVSDAGASVTIDATLPASSFLPARTDMNGDGYPDVIARDAAGILWLYPSKSTGAFAPRVQIGHGWNVMNAIMAPGDFNGDGFADIMARDTTGRLWLYAGTGTGRVRSGVQIGHGWGVMNALVTPGDFNGDGFPDLMARNASGQLFLYPGNGKGGWGTRTQIGHGWQGMTALVSTGDFNGDRKSDLLARDSTGKLFLYPGNGRGGFTARSQAGHGWQVMTALAGPGPWGSEAHADLLARDANGYLYLYRGNGAGGFSGSSKIGQGWSSMLIVQ